MKMIGFNWLGVGSNKAFSDKTMNFRISEKQELSDQLSNC
jgi:hypothetical protein